MSTEELGITERGHDEPGEHAPHVPVSQFPGHGRRSAFIRGAKNGGSPFVNFVWGLAVTLIFALAGAVLFGAVIGVRRVLDRAPAPRPALAEQGAGRPEPAAVPSAERCSGRLARRKRIPGVQSAGLVAMGRAQLPRGADTLSAVSAKTGRLGGDRVDVFFPAGARLAVQYVGDRAIVRSVAVSFEEPRDLCDALVIVGLLDAKATVRVSNTGLLTVESGAKGSLLAEPLSAVVRFGNDGVSVIQISRSATR